MPKNPKEKYALPAGIFIILAMLLLVGGILWLRGITSRPAYQFTAAYKKPGTISEGAAVYFRGVDVGSVTQVALYPDQNYTYITIGIQQKDLRIPTDSDIAINMQGITGQLYVNIMPPDHATTTTAMVRNGDIVRGKDNLTLDKLTEQLNHLAKERTLEKLAISSEKAMENFSHASEKLGHLTDNATTMLAGFEHPTQDAIQQFTRTTKQVEVSLGKFDSITGQLTGQTIPKINGAIEQFTQDTAGVPDTLKSMQQASNQISSPNLITSLHTAVDQFQGTMARYDCLGAQMSHVMDQRFLGFKLLFGKPGNGFQQCQAYPSSTPWLVGQPTTKPN